MTDRPPRPMLRFGGRRVLLFAAPAAVVAGSIAIAVALTGQQSAPSPPPSARGTVSVPTSAPDRGMNGTMPSPRSGTPSSTRPTQDLSTPAKPLAISIPSIGVRSAVIPIGKAADGSLAVPQPGPNEDKVAWYVGSPTPGEAGPAVLEGHIDTVQGPSVFFRLGAMRPGDRIYVRRADRATAVFTVNAVRAYATHGDFPTAQVFGSGLSEPTLRLITCSNFDHSIGHYVGNTVVFAHLSDLRAPRHQ